VSDILYDGKDGAPFVVGIDLGTTHCVLAFADRRAAKPTPAIAPIAQLVARGVVEERPLLPSFVYLPHESEGPQALPWDAERSFAVGEFARQRGAEVPGRVIASAKSWLSHRAVDRRAGVLPIGAPGDVEKISPVEASWRYLEHLAEAFERSAGASLASQDVIVTVPASFDAAARELTVEAALAAGIERVTLLEEPQAALYAWLASRGEAWRKRAGQADDPAGHIEVGDVVLVIDVGGGTTDFSAILAEERDGELELVRLAVGDHILLGGDNMDLALAHLVARKLEAAGHAVDRGDLAALAHAARGAKERLLAPGGPDTAAVALARKGAKLVGGTLRSELTRAELDEVLGLGFFPEVAASARPALRARAGLTELGLPYASDPAITKHLAAFLGRQASALAKHRAARGEAVPSGRASALLCPTKVLFHGGVMKAPSLRARVLACLDAWLASEGAPRARVLESADLDGAVALGAASYGLARHGHGLRIRGGTARAYYVGIEGAAPAVPGVEPPLSALCVAPFGMEEGTDAPLPPLELGVVVGEPVRFRFFGSSSRREDTSGTWLERWTDTELEELAPIELVLPTEGRAEGDVVPVRLTSRVTPVGTLELEAVPLDPLTPTERFALELSVRESAARET
jgi:hypothetical protein